MGGGAEYVLCAHFHTILAVDHNDAGVGHVEGCHGITHEVVHAGAAKHVELLIVELGVEHGGEHRVAVFLFHWEVVANGVASLHSASAFCHTTLIEHRLCECGFPRALTA